MSGSEKPPSEPHSEPPLDRSPKPVEELPTASSTGAATIDWEPLIEAALAQRDSAYAPYSRFKVGAALLSRDGRIFTGGNVENRTYGLTICAERSALVRAVAEGATEFVAIAVAADSSPPATPCGQCRDSLAEFGSELPVMLVNPEGERVEYDLAELLPHPFRFRD